MNNLYVSNDTVNKLGNNLNLALHHKDKLEAIKYLMRLKKHWLDFNNGYIDVQDDDYLYRVLNDTQRDFNDVFGKPAYTIAYYHFIKDYDKVWFSISGTWELR